MKYTLMIDGQPAIKGATVTDFRGEPCVLCNWFDPGTISGGKGGRVQIERKEGPISMYFPWVIHAKFVLEDEEKRTSIEEGIVAHTLAALYKSGARIRVFYGDPDTGIDWCEEHDTMGYVKMSKGISPCWLLVPRSNNYGGAAIMLKNVLKITLSSDPSTVLYQHPDYKKPTPLVHDGSVLIDGVEYAYFGNGPDSYRKAIQWSMFIDGTRNCK